jgi:hypothetical protein
MSWPGGHDNILFGFEFALCPVFLPSIKGTCLFFVSQLDALLVGLANDVFLDL